MLYKQQLPWCGSLVLASSPPQQHRRWECHGFGDDLPWSRYCTTGSCHWSKSIQEDDCERCKSLFPVHSGAPPTSATWRFPSPGASESAWSTVTPHTWGSSSRPLMVHRCNGHRKPPFSQAAGRWNPPPTLDWWLGNPPQCCTVWSFSAGIAHPGNSDGILGSMELFGPICRQSSKCKYGSSCVHTGGPPDQRKAGSRWDSSAHGQEVPLVWCKTWWKLLIAVKLWHYFSFPTAILRSSLSLSLSLWSSSQNNR